MGGDPIPGPHELLREMAEKGPAAFKLALRYLVRK